MLKYWKLLLACIERCIDMFLNYLWNIRYAYAVSKLSCASTTKLRGVTSNYKCFINWSASHDIAFLLFRSLMAVFVFVCIIEILIILLSKISSGYFWVVSPLIGWVGLNKLFCLTWRALIIGWQFTNKISGRWLIVPNTVISSIMWYHLVYQTHQQVFKYTWIKYCKKAKYFCCYLFELYFDLE